MDDAGYWRIGFHKADSLHMLVKFLLMSYLCSTAIKSCIRVPPTVVNFDLIYMVPKHAMICIPSHHHGQILTSLTGERIRQERRNPFSMFDSFYHIHVVFPVQCLSPRLLALRYSVCIKLCWEAHRGWDHPERALETDCFLWRDKRQTPSQLRQECYARHRRQFSCIRSHCEGVEMDPYCRIVFGERPPRH